MNSLKKYAFSGLIVGGTLLMAPLAWADGNAVVNAAQAILSAVSLDWAGFLGQVLSAIQGFGGLSWSLKIAVMVMSLIGLMKVSSLSGFWAKLGSLQAWVAPILGLVLGVLLLGKDGQISLAGIFAYMGSGAGAILLHQLLDTLKAAPWIGPTYVSIINMIEGILPGPLAKKKP